MWIGYGSPSIFDTPEGRSEQVQGLCRWFTNLDISRRHEELITWELYDEEKYPQYDNYDAINVNKVSEIPKDYDGIMGVPITFMDKYCPEQFEIIGLLNTSDEFLAGIKATKTYDDFREKGAHAEYTGKTGRQTNGNPVLKGIPHKGNYYVNEATGEYVYSAYARILIKKIKKKGRNGEEAYRRSQEKFLNIRAFSPQQKKRAYERQNHKCACCGEELPIDKMEGDHITPWSEGGRTIDENLQMLCVECNRRKGTR